MLDLLCSEDTTVSDDRTMEDTTVSLNARTRKRIDGAKVRS